jgi:hypothetical protein
VYRGLEPCPSAPCVYRPSTLHKDALLTNLYGQIIILLTIHGGFSEDGQRSKRVGGCEILGLCRDVGKICVLLGRCAAYSGNSLPTLPHKLLVLPSGVKNFKRIFYS